jgi:hypothetical protein
MSQKGEIVKPFLDETTSSHGDEFALERAPSYPMTTKDLSLTKADLSLTERADELERRLGMALKAYRQRAEEILEQHMDQLEKVQVNQDHEIAMLKAENAKLREMIGKKDDPALLQNVLFQSNAQLEEAKSKKETKNQMKKGSEDDDDKRIFNSKKKGKGTAEQPGGTWQTFVAWVPNGAALANPEPWKPLPQQTLLGVPSPAGGKPEMRSQRSVVASDESSPTRKFQGILPGAVPHEKKDKTEDDDDSDGSKSDEDDGWTKLEILDVWKPSEREMKKGVGSRVPGDADSHYSGEKVDDNEFKEAPHSVFILNPDAGVRVSWDLTSLFMVVYDCIMIPMALFDLPEDVMLAMMDWVTRIFWTLDMGWSCCTGVVLADGSVEYRLRFIIRRYLKTWFALDCIIVGSDWFGVIFSSGGMGLSRLARVSRTVRVVRLLRLARMQEVMANITERIQSDKVMLVLQIAKILVFLVAVCHIVACGWWGVGSSSDGDSWVKENKYENSPIALQYLVSLHWAFSQFSGGMEELRPTRGVERFYTVVVWVFAFMAGLVMLSWLTSNLTQQYIIGGSGARQMATLKKYLNQNKIPKNLIKRLCRSAKHAVSGDLQPDTVDLLNVVSEPLKIEMHYEMYSRVLSCHPFFLDFLNANNQVMRRVCHSCMSMLLLDSGDVLFRRGDEASEPKMYFVCNGILEYRDKYDEVTIVTERMWAGEPALWCAWRHPGTLSATSDAKIGMLDAELFQEVCSTYMKKSKGQAFNPKRYAAAFVEELNKCSELTDLVHKHDD